MKVFKFGGASVKDTAGVKNVLKVLQKHNNPDKLIVISAMGKTTNALEVIIQKYLAEQSPEAEIEHLRLFHVEIMNGLFEHKKAAVFEKINQFFTILRNFLEHNKSKQYDFVYDQIIGFGELISTTIVSEFLSRNGIRNTWIDVRDVIKTDSTYRDAKVDWETTQKKIIAAINPGTISITQGFIGSDSNNFTTSLGREGSDYTAGIFAYCLNAESVTIWKDVPGVLNADPREFKTTTLLQQISYEEAIELAFYGASVIHPKTLQPLQRKEIPLFVKSFFHPENEGTKVCRGNGCAVIPQLPCFIVKKNQALISLSSRDFSFMVEENISEVFQLFHQYQMKVDLIQNSAISFSVCVDNKFNQLEKLIQHLKAKFRVEYQTGVSLYTIRHFNESAINSVEKGKKVLLKQLTHNTVQMVTAG
ncbi:aspartate kinase [Zunongwangia profunda]|uniref:Aspartokinase n=2 Tax=Zunongwangia profunda TaxID=398743 RepID=D5BEU4_ZUNPS|nr:aspartate kinase [Zunongwangia profunda]ADF50823.1 aspartokinase [Zunongwangia profunda SM-A87]MAS69814.1 aspartate kinase [Zunongwangia sp.]HCV80389.1 aspartate kinase [Zunongwangia profunda]|tara:strand:- start:1577 stop:2833 length:1257 start_codon:yes stop_codon:yes gene_type:complete